jgi:hypothetical protein
VAADKVVDAQVFSNRRFPGVRMKDTDWWFSAKDFQPRWFKRVSAMRAAQIANGILKEKRKEAPTIEFFPDDPLKKTKIRVIGNDKPLYRKVARLENIHDLDVIEK